MIKQKLLGILGNFLIRLLGLTLRYKLHFKNKEDETFFLSRHKEKKPTQDSRFLIAFFHQDEICLLNYFKNRNICVLVSISKDGEIMKTITSLLGFVVVRGSSSKKAISGLIACIKKVKQGYKAAFAVDGPRGPLHQVKEGVCAVAKKTQSEIIPIRAYPRKVKIFTKSWSKAKLPLPFSKIDIYIGHPKIYATNELQEELINLGS